MGLNTKDKIIRARVQMMKKYPFFGYLAMYLNLIEAKEIGEDGQGNKGS